MKTRLITLLLAALTALPMTARTRKALYVIIDGIPASQLERLKPPVLSSIARAGAYSRGHCGGDVGRYNETPTISAIGYSNINTGTWMNKHNVRGNSNIQANYNYPTLFRLAKDQKRPFTTAVYTSWTDNRTILLGEGRPETRNLKIDYIVDGFDLDKARFPHKDGDREVLDYDAATCKGAAECIANHAPDLNWLYLWYTDDAYHINGHGHIGDEAIMSEDSLLGQVWRAIQKREKEHDEEWLVIVTTDHGRQYDGHSHGGQSTTERTIWMATNYKKVNGEFSPSRLSHVDIYPTICRFLGFEIPEEQRPELDGVSFIGPEDIYDLDIEPWDGDVTLHWKHTKKRVNADIYYAASNNYASGGSDRWVKVATVPSTDGSYRFKAGSLPKASFIKFAVITSNTALNRWWK